MTGGRLYVGPKARKHGINAHSRNHNEAAVGIGRPAPRQPGGALVGRSWHVVLGPGSKLKWTATVQMSKEFACKECALYSRRLSMHLRPYFRICFLVFLSVVSKTFNRKKGSDKLTFPFKRSSTKSHTNRPHLKVSVMYNWGFD